MAKTNTIGIDLAKNIFHLCIQDSQGHILSKEKLSRTQMKAYFSTTPVSRVVFESCATAHYWTRVASSHGHEVAMIHPAYIKPFVKTNKNDFNDAEAICEADSRPTMRYVEPKTQEQQDIQLLHRVRQRQVQQRTATANQIRAQLLEYGLAIPQGFAQIKRQLPLILDDSESLSPAASAVFRSLLQELRDIDQRVSESTKTIHQLAQRHPICRQLMTIPGIGPMVATALVAAIGNAATFKNGRELSAWLGLVPKQHSTGGKAKLLGISKRGDSYLRSLLVQGALSALTRCKTRQDDQIIWARALREKKGLQIAAVALANKMGRIIWHVMTKKRDYRPTMTA